MSKKKKILFCITKGNFGGAQRYVYDLATNLPKSQFEAMVACGTKEGTSLIQKLAERNVRTITLESSEREINLKNDLKTLRTLIEIIKEEKPEIVHLNSSKMGLLGSFAVFILKLTGKHRAISVFTAHNWAFNEKNRPLFSRIIHYIGHYWTVVFCDITIAVSEKIKRDIAWVPGWHFLKDKIKVIYNGSENFRMLSKKEARQFLAGADDKKTIIFSVSELHPNKGVDVALKALAMLPKEKRVKIIYCIAGSGEERDKLQNMAKNIDILDTVKFLEFVPDAKKYLSGADIFLLPSRNEAFPYVILEAGIAGMPIIATSVGGIPEIIKDMQNGILVHPRNPKEIAEAIIYLLDHKEKQEEFGNEIKKTVTNFFSLDRMLSETLKIYNLKISD